MIADKLILFIFGLFGFILFIISAVAITDIKLDCTTATIKNLWITLLILGLSMATLSTSYGVCISNKNCIMDPDNKASTTGLHYMLFIILFVVLIGLSASIIDKINKLNETQRAECLKKNVPKNSAIFILSFSILALLISLYYLYRYYIETKRN